MLQEQYTSGVGRTQGERKPGVRERIRPALLFALVRLGLRRPRTLADLRRDGLLDGWEPGTPPISWTEAFRIDQDAARGWDCTVCGHHGLRYLPYRRAQHRGVREWGYRAFAQCPRCGHVEEF